MDDRGGSFVAVRRISQGLERGNACHTTSGIFTFLPYLTVQTFAHFSLYISIFLSLSLSLSVFAVTIGVFLSVCITDWSPSMSGVN